MNILTTATQQAAEASNTQYHVPNELLLIGYFEDMEMGVS